MDRRPTARLSLAVPALNQDAQISLVVPPGTDERLDIVLPAVATASGYPLSRRAARRLIAAGAVYVDGRRLQVASRRTRGGALIEVMGTDDRPASPVFELSEADILFRDAWLIAIAKPSGLPAQATVSDARDHVEAAVRRYLAREKANPYVALHHRLDWGTSGVMVLATDREANAGLASAFANHKAQKCYRALVDGQDEGPPVAWSMRNRLARVEDDRGRWRVGAVGLYFEGSKEGKEAITEFRRLEPATAGAVGVVALEAIPRTGRLHQVRCHLAEAGWPVLGDRRYGGPAAPRLMLHASRLELPHPVTGKQLVLTCPAPVDFAPDDSGIESRPSR